MHSINISAYYLRVESSPRGLQGRKAVSRKHFLRESIPRNLRIGRSEKSLGEMPSGPRVPHPTDTLPALTVWTPLRVVGPLQIYMARGVSLRSEGEL